MLQWNRPQQAAFLVYVWQAVAETVGESKLDWAKEIREYSTPRELPFDTEDLKLDQAFASNYSLLATDQGVRGVLQVTNDMCYVAADRLHLADWQWDGQLEEETIGEETVTKALISLRKQPAKGFVQAIAKQLAKFDWRASSIPGLSESERRARLVFRGSSGYKEIRHQLLQCLQHSPDNAVSSASAEVIDRLGY